MKQKARNSADMKSYNRRLVVNMLRREKLSRADIARKIDLTRAGVSLIIDELINDGIVIEVGLGDSGLGRKPVELSIDAGRYHAIGLDISRKDCVIGAIDLNGNVLYSHNFIIDNKVNANDAIDIIKDQTMELLKRNASWGELAGMGLSVPGPIDTSTGKILNPPNFGLWHGVNIVDLLKKKLGFDIYLENNAISRTLCEKHYGVGKKLKSFISMIVDTGVGAGIVIDNRLYRGYGGYGSEIGHTCIDINGKTCSCGNIGCVELYASIPAVLEKAEAQNVNVDSWEKIVDKAEEGNKVCQELIRDEGRYLGAAIVNSMNVLELDAVVLIGDISYKPKALIDIISKYVNNHSINRSIRSIPIYISEFDGNARIVSAATIAIDRFFIS